jgi:hypothetical protein
MRVIYTVGPCDLSPFSIVVTCYNLEKIRNVKYCYNVIYSDFIGECVDIIDGEIELTNKPTA